MPHHPQPWNAAQTISVPPPLVTATTASPSTIVSWTELRPPRTTTLLLSLHHCGLAFTQPNKSNRCRHLLLSFKIVCLGDTLAIVKVYVTTVMVLETALILPTNAGAKILGDVLDRDNIEWIYQDLVRRP
ncbi:uncharacterized protein LOC127243985 [Andrographis paniculata]|uniref:uncharacterized protein LOC127243985 n=1 Tax=Andrographis paniculata TaxID=175694 RepID=UPI0021E77F65|nr:uncharacterized protein LOC127243985 [Andrographis paniculata]